jgi:hypothetical protein
LVSKPCRERLRWHNALVIHEGAGKFAENRPGEERRNLMRSPVAQSFAHGQRQVTMRDRLRSDNIEWPVPAFICQGEADHTNGVGA